MAAQGLHRSQTALGAYLRRMKAALGAPKAITATARKLALRSTAPSSTASNTSIPDKTGTNANTKIASSNP